MTHYAFPIRYDATLLISDPASSVVIAVEQNAGNAMAQRLSNKALWIYHTIEMLKFCLYFCLLGHFPDIFSIFIHPDKAKRKDIPLKKTT